MEELWQGACNHFDIPTNIAKKWFVLIKTRMNEESDRRSYTNWNIMLKQKKQYLIHLDPVIVLAAFFQYYYYDGNVDYVKHNCDAFENFCRDANFEDEEIKSLILKLLGDKTIKNLHASYENYFNQLQDLDLSVVAAPEQEYKIYNVLLRREYSQMDDDSYKMMRTRVLETLLTIPKIFVSSEFHDPLEARARRNLLRELQEMKNNI